MKQVVILVAIHAFAAHALVASGRAAFRARNTLVRTRQADQLAVVVLGLRPALAPAVQIAVLEQMATALPPIHARLVICAGNSACVYKML